MKSFIKTDLITAGVPYPLGATLVEGGVNFALFSDHATAAEVCLFDTPDSHTESLRIPMLERTENVFHVFVPGLVAGQLYGFRVDGPWQPHIGHWFNPKKLLVDPYARAVAGKIWWCEEMASIIQSKTTEAGTGDVIHPPATAWLPEPRDNAFAVPKCVVVDDQDFDWEGDRPPRVPWTDTVFYEVHVAGLSRQWKAIPEAQRGTFAAMGSPEAIQYFRQLGVTSIELLPVHEHVDDEVLAKKGLGNYWGYNTLAFFAPESSYSSAGSHGGQVAEFKQMVKNLHQAGLEVILDVVYNHTAEGNHFGPTLSFRGIDNAAYYRLMPDQPQFYRDYTGCGNTPDITHPRVLQLVMDSLRYWVTEMHVDGFRFDLATTLAREAHLPDMRGAFLDAMHQDPVLSRVKLIAEPWDVGEGGYLVGNFPILWSEWNGKFRDTVRCFWKSDGGLVADLAYKLSGSPEFYQLSGRRPWASVNFITAHDGFTLTDLVSYHNKYNLANGEENRDGDNHNASWNCGHEGPSDDPHIIALRDRQRRNFLVTLFLSQGVPLLNAGDETGRTQHGNNNVYCQDNELGWLSWPDDPRSMEILEFTRRLIHFRRQHPVFRHPKFFNGKMIHEAGMRDVSWFHPDGGEMTDEMWRDPAAQWLAMMLCGDSPALTGSDGRRYRDDSFLLLCNAAHEGVTFQLPGPAGRPGRSWQLILDTRTRTGFLRRKLVLPVGRKVRLTGHSLRLFRLI